jgi:hypothetical protein
MSFKQLLSMIRGHPMGNPITLLENFSHSTANNFKASIRSKEMETEEEDCFESPASILPEDCLLHIFSYLTISELGRASRVSKSWKYISESDILWRKFILMEFPG